LETFNQYILNVAVELAEKIKPSTVQCDTFLPGSLYFYLMDACEVMSVCNMLKYKSSSGHDKIVSWVAKTSMNAIAEPLVINC